MCNKRRKHRQRFGALGSGWVCLSCHPAATLLLGRLGRGDRLVRVSRVRARHLCCHPAAVESLIFPGMNVQKFKVYRPIFSSFLKSSFFQDLRNAKKPLLFGEFQTLRGSKNRVMRLCCPPYCCYLRRRGALCACLCVGACAHAGMGGEGPFKQLSPMPFFSSSGS